MKTSKKILSIVLAVMLLVGTVAVGASAETMVYEKAGSRLVYTATADKEANADGIIEVNPGDTVTVSVYAQANYYLGTTGKEIFCWTATLFDTITADDVTTHNFVNNYSPTKKVIASTSASQLGAGYSNGTYAGFYYARGYSTDCTSPYDASEATLAYTFNFTVPEDIAPGTTGEFRMPETCSATVATTSRMKQIFAAVNNSATAYGSTSLGSEFPETIDLTGTILNFKVASAEAPEVPCDYAELDAAIAAYEAKLADKDLYENWADYEAAYDAAKAVARDMIVDEAGANQATIDAAADALNAVVLVYKAADYAAVEAAKAKIPADLNDGIYTSASVKAVEDAVAAVVEGYDITKQAEVDAFAAAIEEAVANLVKLGNCDYAALDAAIAKTPEYGEDYYDAAEYEAYEDAFAAAKAVERDMIADEAGVNQAKIDAAKSALDAAYNALVPKFVDRSALEAAIAQTPEYGAEYYDEELYAAWQDAVTAGRDTYEGVEGEADTEDFRNEVAAATDAINNAFAKLVPQFMDYSALEKAVADYGTTPEDADAYTSETYDAYEEALFVAQDYLVNKDDKAPASDEEIAAEVAATAKALEDAFNNLKIKEYCDYSNLEAAVNNYASLDAPEEYYDATELAEWQAALAAAQALLAAEKLEKTDDNQAIIDNAAAALEKEYNDLVEQYIDLTELKNAIADCEDTEYESARYTTDSFAAYEAALAAAEKAVIDYDNAPDTQAIRDIVAEAKDNLVAAYNALELNKVDCSALEAAIAQTPEYGEEYYPVDKWAAYEKAVADGTADLAQLKSADDTDENREAVQAAADAILDAIAALVPEFMDYSALEKAVADYGTTPEAADAYTPETYDAYEEALFAANDILANKDENAPASDAELAAEIAAAAKALEDAYNALELKPIVAIVTNVTTKEEYFQVGDTVEFDYLVSITGITKLQVKFTSGTTMTYTRTHSLVTITDNGDGTETWTIATPIFADSVSAVAKAKLGKVWEEGGYPFSYQTKKKPTPTEDIEVKSVTILNNDVAVDSFTTKDTVVVRIVAGPDTLRMRLVSEGGSTSTYTRDKAYQDENGNWVWDITTHRTTAKSYKFDIYTAGKNNRLVDEGTDLTYTVTAPVVYVGPSTGNNADIVISATVAKTRLLVGDKQTVTVVTDKDALGVRIVDAEGDVHYQTKDTTLAVDNGDGTLTWTFNVGCGYAATFNFDVQALYKNQWLNNGTTLTYRVVY